MLQVGRSEGRDVALPAALRRRVEPTPVHGLRYVVGEGRVIGVNVRGMEHWLVQHRVTSHLQRRVIIIATGKMWLTVNLYSITISIAFLYYFKIH